MRYALPFVIGLALAAPESTAAQSLDEAPVVFKAGSWRVVRAVDTMTDEVRCTGLLQAPVDVQLTSNGFYINMRGKGGVSSVTLRFDEETARDMRLPTDAEKDLSIVMLLDEEFRRALSADRIRVQILGVIRGLTQHDFDISGISEAHDFIEQCGN